MKNTIKKRIFIVSSFILLGLSITACGQSVEKLNQYGNDAYAKQLYAEALESYQSAQFESPELAVPYYNAANALYRQGNYSAAVDQLDQALNLADNESLQKNGLYNLGNNAYNSRELQAAVEAYKGALLIDPGDLDAKYNLELALQQQQEQQDQQQQEQQDQEQNQDQNSENSDSSKKDSENDNEQDQSDREQQADNQENESNPSDTPNEEQSENEEEQNQESQQSQNNRDQSEDADPPQNSQIPAPGQKMTPEQAKQLLAAIAQNMETLQEKLGQVLFVQELPPLQDW